MAVQVKHKAFNGKDPIANMNLLTYLDRTFDSSERYESASVCLFIYVMTESYLATSKEWLILSSSVTDKSEDTIASYAGIVKDLLKSYATGAAVGNLDDQI